MNLFDKDGYYNLTKVMSSTKAMKIIIESCKELVKFDQDHKRNPFIIGFKKMLGKGDYNNIETTCGIKSISGGAMMLACAKLGRPIPSIKDIVSIQNAQHLNTAIIGNILNGGKAYKIRASKVEYLNNIKLNIPSSYIVHPHRSTHIMLPFGAFKVAGLSLTNIYILKEGVSKEESVESAKIAKIEKDIDSWSTVTCMFDSRRDVQVEDVISDTDVVGDQTMVIPLPIYKSNSIQDVIGVALDYIESSNKNPAPWGTRECINKIYNFIINFFSYLTTESPDVKEALGVREITVSRSMANHPIALNHHNYQYYDVGRIYDERVKREGGFGASNGSGTSVVSMVRAHIRMQWYGSKQDDKPGTHQKPILIEEFIRGGEEAMNIISKPITVG